MEKIDMILWILGAGFGINFSIMVVMWNHLTSTIKEVKNEIKEVKNDLGSRIDKLDEKVTDIDRRLCRLEGSFMSKECCMIKDERQLKKAE